jgi:peptidylprolyl isomerase
MKSTPMILLLAASSFAAYAQTAAKPATAKPATASSPAKTATAAKTGATAARPAASAAIKLPPGVPPVKGLLKTAFSLRYQDSVLGVGKEAESGKLCKVLYTGYRAADGVSFDSSEEHRLPLKDKDGKPVLGEDGKPKLDAPQPMAFPIGMGRVIPGFDQGFAGMKEGGKRRIFIPYQLAYGTRDMPAHGTEHPGIPPKSDLIFDVQLVSVEDMPAPPSRPGMGGMMPHPMPGANAPRPGTPGAPAAPGSPAVPARPAFAPAPATPSASAAAPAASAPTATPATATKPAAAATPSAPAATATPAAPQSK